MLTEAGIDFEKLRTDGIEHDLFMRKALTHSLFQPDQCVWIGFHTDHDFFYLINLLTGQDLPKTGLSDFLNVLSGFIGTFVDLKVISDNCPEFQRGSLKKLSE